MRHYLPSVIVVLLAVCLGARADQISLNNGDRLSGTILRADGKTLALDTRYAGELSVSSMPSPKFSRAQNCISSSKTAGRLWGRSRPWMESFGSLPPAGTVESHLSGLKALRNQAEETAYEKTAHGGLLEDWQGGLNLGFALTRGNSETKNLSLGFTAVRHTLRDKLSAYASSVYASNDASGAFPHTTANTAGGGLRYDHDLRKKVLAFAATDFFADALQGLNLRSVFGAGAGYHAIKDDRTTLDLLAGANYTHESYTTLARNLVALTLGEELLHKLGKSTTLNQRLYFFPDLNSAGDFRGTFDLATVTKFSDVYVTNPPPTKRQNDLIFTTGLNVSFGRETTD